MKSSPEKPDYYSEGDADTLMRAAEIHGDPKRHSAAMKHVNKKKKAINSIADIRKKAKDMNEEDSDEL